MIQRTTSSCIASLPRLGHHREHGRFELALELRSRRRSPADASPRSPRLGANEPLGEQLQASEVAAALPALVQGRVPRTLPTSDPFGLTRTDRSVKVEQAPPSVTHASGWHDPFDQASPCLRHDRSGGRPYRPRDQSVHGGHHGDGDPTHFIGGRDEDDDRSACAPGIASASRATVTSARVMVARCRKSSRPPRSKAALKPARSRMRSPPSRPRATAAEAGLEVRTLPKGARCRRS